MGDLVSFRDDVDNLGQDFTRAATRLHDALTHLQQASNTCGTRSTTILITLTPLSLPSRSFSSH